ncbi:hypothetical protein GCM10010297_04620 [Streptomyces malachitofuscus]|nr:hypothetical protein GCM10010297_04620 [Streptomyces malachitofuscus]
MATHPSTYDPVVDVRPLPPVPPASPLRAPRGRALVLVPDAGPVRTVRPGERVPDGWFAPHRMLYLVDTTEHRLVLDLRPPGRDGSAAFRCRVELMCRVTDPAAVVTRGIRDMGAAWHGLLEERLRNVARGYGAGQLREAERALNAALRDVTGDAAVRLYGARAALLGHEGASRTPGRSRVRGTRLRPGTSAAADGSEVLLGEVVARKEEPLPPKPSRPPELPPPAPERRVSRVRGTGTPGDGRLGGGRR